MMSRRSRASRDEWECPLEEESSEAQKSRFDKASKGKGGGKSKGKADDDVEMTPRENDVKGLSGSGSGSLPCHDVRMLLSKTGSRGQDSRRPPLKLYIPVKHWANNGSYTEFIAACIHSVILRFIVLTQIWSYTTQEITDCSMWFIESTEDDFEDFNLDPAEYYSRDSLQVEKPWTYFTVRESIKECCQRVNEYWKSKETCLGISDSIYDYYYAFVLKFGFFRFLSHYF